MMTKQASLLLLKWILFNLLIWVSSVPFETNSARFPRQVNFYQNPDGSFTASIAASEAMQFPGGGSTNFGIAETINFGPQGSSMSGGESFSSDIGGNRMSFGQANSQNSRFGPNGFSSTGSNSNSNSFQNPFFQNSNANANAFANQFNSPFG